MRSGLFDPSLKKHELSPLLKLNSDTSVASEENK